MVDTEDTAAVNSALAAPAGIVTVLGVVTFELLLDRFAVTPPLGAVAVSVTVQVSVPAPVMAPLLQDSRLNGGGVPVPLRLITVVPPVEELLTMVSWPAAAPVTLGLNSTFSVIVWPGVNVAGKATAESAKSAPVTVAELTVSGAVPADVTVTDSVGSALTTTLPKVKLVALISSVDVPGLTVNVTACVTVA